MCRPCRLISVLPRPFLQGAAPCPFLVTPCPLNKAEMMPLCFFYQFFFKCQLHMLLALFCPFLLSTHSVDCAVPLLLSVHRINSALFPPFTALIVPFFFSSPRHLCPFDGPFTALNVPFSDGTLPFWKPGQNTAHYQLYVFPQSCLFNPPYLFRLSVYIL